MLSILGGYWFAPRQLHSIASSASAAWLERSPTANFLERRLNKDRSMSDRKMQGEDMTNEGSPDIIRNLLYVTISTRVHVKWYLCWLALGGTPTERQVNGMMKRLWQTWYIPLDRCLHFFCHLYRGIGNIRPAHHWGQLRIFHLTDPRTRSECEKTSFQWKHYLEIKLWVPVEGLILE